MHIINAMYSPVEVCRCEHGDDSIHKPRNSLEEELSENVFVFVITLLNCCTSSSAHLWAGSRREKGEGR